MKFMLLIYNESALLDALPANEFDARMRDCLTHADELREQGCLLETQMLEGPATARSVRVRNGRRTTIDGPFAEAKEVLGGFNVIEATDMDDAIRIAEQFPWVHTGRVEVRPIQDIEEMRQRVGGTATSAAIAPRGTQMNDRGAP